MKNAYDTENAYIQADLVFPLFDGGNRGGKRQKALLEVKKTRQDLSAQKKQVTYESQTAFLELEIAREILKTLEDELISARIWIGNLEGEDLCDISKQACYIIPAAEYFESAG